MNISIIVPTYNESVNLPELVKRIDDACKRAAINEEILVVDDNSPDSTAQIAKELSQIYSVRVHVRIDKRDLASAVVDGINLCTNEVIGVIDADLSHPPEIIPSMVALLNRHDLVLGSRYIHDNGVEEWTFFRKMISLGATLLSHPLVKVKDPMSGFFFFHRKILNGVILKPKGYKILLEIIVRCNVQNVGELAYTFQNRRIGNSKMGLKQIIQYLLQLFSLYGVSLIRKLRK